MALNWYATSYFFKFSPGNKPQNDGLDLNNPDLLSTPDSFCLSHFNFPFLQCQLQVLSHQTGDGFPNHIPVSNIK